MLQDFMEEGLKRKTSLREWMGCFPEPVLLGPRETGKEENFSGILSGDQRS